MRKIVLIVWFLMATNFLIAQDTLYKENGSVMVVKIIEKNATQVKYKSLINSDGLTYVILKDDVKKIVHENGSFDVFAKDTFNLIRPTGRFNKKVKQEPRKFSKKAYYLNITEANFILSKAPYEDGLLVKSKYKFSMGLQITNGIRFCKRHFLGLGFGINTSLKESNAPGRLNGIPIFIDYRYYILNKKTDVYCNLASGLFISESLSHINNADYLPFSNPTIGISFPISRGVFANFSIGYSLFIYKSMLLTVLNQDDYYRYYNYNSYIHALGSQIYSYRQHEGWNNKNCINLKLGFVF